MLLNLNEYADDVTYSISQSSFAKQRFGSVLAGRPGEHELDLPSSWQASHPGILRDALPLPGGTAAGRDPAETKARHCLRELQALGSTAQFLHAFTWRQHFQQLGCCSPLPGENEVRGNLRQRLEHKPALVGSGVRKNKNIAVPHLVPESNQVEIQRAGFVQRLLRPAAKFLFQGLQFGQQRIRRFARSRLQAHDRIQAHPDRYIDHVYGETENGGTSYLILSQVPFGELGLPALPSRPVKEVSEEVMGFTIPFALGLGTVLTAVAAGVHLYNQKKEADTLKLETSEPQTEETI